MTYIRLNTGVTYLEDEKAYYEFQYDQLRKFKKRITKLMAEKIKTIRGIIIYSGFKESFENRFDVDGEKIKITQKYEIK